MLKISINLESFIHPWLFTPVLLKKPDRVQSHSCNLKRAVWHQGADLSRGVWHPCGTHADKKDTSVAFCCTYYSFYFKKTTAGFSIQELLCYKMSHGVLSCTLSFLASPLSSVILFVLALCLIDIEKIMSFVVEHVSSVMRSEPTQMNLKTLMETFVGEVPALHMNAWLGLRVWFQKANIQEHSVIEWSPGAQRIRCAGHSSVFVTQAFICMI